MDERKLKILEQLLSHLSGSQGMDLKAMLDESKMPKEGMDKMDDMANSDSPDEMDAMGKPKGLKVESVEIMGKPKGMGMDKSNPLASGDKPEMMDKMGMDKMGMKDSSTSDSSSDPEMTDEEFEELLKKFA